MSKLNFKGEGEQHNFWQNYTDLMSGFLIVFIISSIVAWYGYIQVRNSLGGDSSANIKVTIKQSRMIREFMDAQKLLQSDYFKYNEEYQRFECTVDVLFDEQDDKIPAANTLDLINAGRELESIIEKFNNSVNVAFKVVIEGRAARHLNYPTKAENEAADKRGWKYAETLSYNRARNLYGLWQDNGILKDIEKMNGEVFISGSGFGGQGRYTGYGKDGEDRNKTFIIQIIPYIKYN